MSQYCGQTRAVAPILWLVCLVATLAPGTTRAIDLIPNEDGFAGFVLGGFGAMNVANNIIAEGPRVLGDIGYKRIDSI